MSARPIECILSICENEKGNAEDLFTQFNKILKLTLNRKIKNCSPSIWEITLKSIQKFPQQFPHSKKEYPKLIIIL